MAPGQDEDPAVVVVRMCDAFPDECWEEAERRVEAELVAAGFAVATLSGEVDGEEARRQELDALAQRHRAIGALRIVRESEAGGVDLWIVDRVTGKTSFRHLGADDLEGADAPELVALRTVELLHASFLELAAPHPPRGEQAPPPVVEEFVEQRSNPPTVPMFLARVGASVAGGPGGEGAVAGPTVGMGWGFHRLLRLDADLWATALHNRVTSEAGSARIGLGAGTVHLMIRPVPAARVSPAFGVGGGFLLGWASGDAEPGFVANREVIVVGMPSAAFNLAVVLKRRLRLFAGVRATVAVPEVEVRLGGRRAARYGRPLVDGSVGLEWSWDAPDGSQNK